MSGNDEANVFCIREIKPNKQHLLYIKVYQGPLGGGGSLIYHASYFLGLASFTL